MALIKRGEVFLVTSIRYSHRSSSHKKQLLRLHPG